MCNARKIQRDFGANNLPSWREVNDEVKSVPLPLDLVRVKYIELMHQYTGRNVIAYYSAFLQKPGQSQSEINDNDMNSFMQVVHGLDRTKGLDLILHTPGGNIAATESIVEYLKAMFNNDIRAIIPQIAMSAGTMIALSAKEIIMGKQSNLGPIDPQYYGYSCAGVIDEFKTALKDIQDNPESIQLWQLIIGKYHPTLLGDCQNAVKWAETMATKWLGENMFKNVSGNIRIIEKIVQFLSSHSKTYSHEKHIHIGDLKNLGMKITALEDSEKHRLNGCEDFQDCVLTLHHAYMHTLANTKALKIVENQDGVAVFLNLT